MINRPKITRHNRGKPTSQQEISIRLDANQAALLWALVSEGDKAIKAKMNDYEAHIFAIEMRKHLKAVGLPKVIDDFGLCLFNERNQKG